MRMRLLKLHHICEHDSFQQEMHLFEIGENKGREAHRQRCTLTFGVPRSLCSSDQITQTRRLSDAKSTMLPLCSWCFLQTHQIYIFAIKVQMLECALIFSH